MILNPVWVGLESLACYAWTLEFLILSPTQIRRVLLMIMWLFNTVLVWRDAKKHLHSLSLVWSPLLLIPDLIFSSVHISQGLSDFGGRLAAGIANPIWFYHLARIFSKYLEVHLYIKTTFNGEWDLVTIFGPENALNLAKSVKGMTSETYPLLYYNSGQCLWPLKAAVGPILVIN